MRGYSSVGRAPALQAGGQEFESLYLHHEVRRDNLMGEGLYIENYIMKNEDNDKYRERKRRGNEYLERYK